MLFGTALIEQGKATEAQIAEALECRRNENTSERLGEVLVRLGVITEQDVVDTLGILFHIETVASIPEEALAPELVRELPVDWARNRHMLPIRWKERPAVLICDPAQTADLNDLSLLLNADLMPVLATRTAIEMAIQQCYYRQTESTRDFIRDLNQKGRETPAEARRESDSQDLLRTVESAPVTQLVNLILLEAAKNRASDIHLEPFEQHLRVRYRIDGLLYEQAAPPKQLEAALVSRLKVMGHLDIAEKRLPQDGMTQVHIGDLELDIRISTIPVADGERVVLRLLNTERLIRPLSELGMPPAVEERFFRVMHETSGAIWVTGPTGSGKTTTLYSALQSIDTARRNVLTIEDPVEYKISSIGQMAVKTRIGLTFAQGLRHILRQDPDVILVGETRDLETAEIAIRASLTGHLVFSTLHTNDALGAIVRLVDMGIPPYLVAGATRAVMAQRLVRTVCPHCAAPVALGDEERLMLGRWADDLKGVELREGGGCPRCMEGFSGRAGIYELVEVDRAMHAIIRRGGTPEELRHHIDALQIPGLMDDAVAKIKSGVTSVAEVIRVMGRCDG
ncbi:MAG: ATPase, T2SS/T4P/T4SS family [Kiritimatiellae bacterium]|nr:ATPase, T2SS/T4P/T4SS family [Kiritimatiellia bacterium]MDD4735523.1 ATPase, T2SS/T4P/T4SS family [Kiritimatiellia bacterium]